MRSLSVVGITEPAATRYTEIAPFGACWSREISWLLRNDLVIFMSTASHFGNHRIPEYSIIRSCCYRYRWQFHSISPDFFCKQTGEGDYIISECEFIPSSRSNDGGSIEHQQSTGNETCRRRGGEGFYCTALDSKNSGDYHRDCRALYREDEGCFIRNFVVFCLEYW